MRINTLARSVAALLVVVGGLSGCASPGEQPLNVTGEESVAEVTEPAVEPVAPEVAAGPDEARAELGTGKVIRIGIPFDYPGIGLMNEKTDIPSGFAVDIAAYLAWKLGYSPYDIEWVPAPTADRVPLLKLGKVDMVVAPMTITEQRAKDIVFAGPHLITGQDILVRANDTSINSKEDLSGKTLCAVPSSTSLDRIIELFGDDVNMIYEKNYELCIRHVVDGDADAVSTDDAILAGHASTDEFYRLVRVLGKPFSEERYGIGLPYGSHNLCLQVNQALTDMVQDGSWKKFIDRHVAGTHFFEDRYDNPPALDKCK